MCRRAELRAAIVGRGGGDGRDRRSGRLLQRADGAAGPHRDAAVRVHDPAVCGPRRHGGRRRWPSRGAHAAAGAALDPGSTDSTPSRSAASQSARPARDAGPTWPVGSWRTRWPCSIPTLAFLLLLGAPFLHVRFNAPDATILPASVPIAGRVRPAPAAVRRGRVRATLAGGPDDRTGDLAGEPRRALRLDAAARGGSAHHAGREPRRRRPAADALAVPAAVRRCRAVRRIAISSCSWPRRRVATSRRSRLHPVRAEPRRGPCARPRPARRVGPGSRRRRDVGASSAAARRR